MPPPESISHIRRDLLPRPVRSYADKLNAELRGIWQELGIKTMAEFNRLVLEKKIPEAVVRKYRDLITRLADVVRSGKIPDDYPVVECQDKRIDLNEVLKASRDFYTSHNLQALADVLPDTLDALTPEQRKRIEFALEQGFTSAIILPPPDLLQEKLDNLIEECATRPSDKLTGDHQYHEPSNTVGIKSLDTINRLKTYSYLLLYSPGSVPFETKHQSAEVLTKLFVSKHWNGLTLPEYLILQRIEAETRGNHSFDAYDGAVPQNSNWTWLLDSQTASAVVGNADWNSAECRVKTRGFSSWDSTEELGARPSVVVEI